MWACSWTDPAGNLWLFGGLGFASTSVLGDLNDLWEYSNGKWAWMGGSDHGIGFGQGNEPGIYGTMGVADAANQPGARDSATCWTDPQGNFWLYGGSGFDSTATAGNLGDLWRYGNGEWTWMAGSNIAAQPGIAGAWQGAAVYGTEGVPAPGNTPGMREWASGWADSSGSLWLFGGGGVASAQGSIAEIGAMNDLWKYSNGMWAWMAGSDQVDQYGTYGVLGTPAPGNTPGTRSGAVTWTDSSGNLWLFGGEGVGTSGDDCGGSVDCVLNDLWEFKPSLNEWTWVGGPDLSNQPGVFGTQGVAAPANLPPPRWLATAWTDSEGNFWLFGGDALAPYTDYNDLWKYSNGEWTWESGSNQFCQEPGVYGTLGTPAAANYPGGRTGAVGWADKSGNLWLFGGGILVCEGYNSASKLNDLWEYQP
jgi:hypothetical protein